MPIDKKPLNLYQYEEGYRYNSDSLLLYDFISSFGLKNEVLDVGSGSGILGLLLKKEFSHISLSQIDIQKEHVILSEKNARENSLESRVFLGDFLEFTFNKQFDAIISNPPFYHKGAQKSSNRLLHVSRHSDALPFEHFVKKVKKVLKPKGEFFFCYDAKQIDTLLSSLFINGIKPKHIRFVHRKQKDDATLVLIHAQKGSKALCNILHPLFMYDTKGILYENIDNIYKKSNTQSLTWQK